MSNVSDASASRQVVCRDRILVFRPKATKGRNGRRIIEEPRRCSKRRYGPQLPDAAGAANRGGDGWGRAIAIRQTDRNLGRRGLRPSHPLKADLREIHVQENGAVLGREFDFAATGWNEHRVAAAQSVRAVLRFHSRFAIDGG